MKAENIDDSEYFDWLDEPNVKSHEEAIELVESWRSTARELEPTNTRERENKEKFLSASDHLILHPDIYDRDFYHGTTMAPIESLLEEMVLRASSNNKKCGEHQSLPRVSSTSNIYDAVSFAKRYTPVLDDVKRSVEKDILGQELPDSTSRKDLKKIIREHLHNDEPWKVNGIPVQDAVKPFIENNFSRKDIRRWQNRNYHSMLDRIEDIGEERDPPVVFGYPIDSLEGEVKEIYTPLFQNELRLNRLSEIQSGAVDIYGEGNSIFVPEYTREEFGNRKGLVPEIPEIEQKRHEFKYKDRLSIGSLEALEIYHLAKNSSNYREEQVIRADKPQWEGDFIFPQKGSKDKRFDVQDLTANPYDVELVG